MRLPDIGTKADNEKYLEVTQYLHKLAQKAPDLSFSAHREALKKKFGGFAEKHDRRLQKTFSNILPKLRRASGVSTPQPPKKVPPKPPKKAQKANQAPKKQARSPEETQKPQPAPKTKVISKKTLGQRPVKPMEYLNQVGRQGPPLPKTLGQSTKRKFFPEGYVDVSCAMAGGKDKIQQLNNRQYRIFQRELAKTADKGPIDLSKVPSLPPKQNQKSIGQPSGHPKNQQEEIKKDKNGLNVPPPPQKSPLTITDDEDEQQRQDPGSESDNGHDVRLNQKDMSQRFYTDTTIFSNRYRPQTPTLKERQIRGLLFSCNLRKNQVEEIRQMRLVAEVIQKAIFKVDLDQILEYLQSKKKVSEQIIQKYKLEIIKFAARRVGELPFKRQQHIIGRGAQFFVQQGKEALAELKKECPNEGIATKFTETLSSVFDSIGKEIDAMILSQRSLEGRLERAETQIVGLRRDLQVNLSIELAEATKRLRTKVVADVFNFFGQHFGAPMPPVTITCDDINFINCYHTKDILGSTRSEQMKGYKYDRFKAVEEALGRDFDLEDDLKSVLKYSRDVQEKMSECPIESSEDKDIIMDEEILPEVQNILFNMIDDVVLAHESLQTHEEKKGQELSQQDIPQMDIPQTDIPQADIPQADIPQADIPQTDIPNENIQNTPIQNKEAEKPIQIASQADEEGLEGIQEAMNDNSLQSQQSPFGEIQEQEMEEEMKREMSQQVEEEKQQVQSKTQPTSQKSKPTTITSFFDQMQSKNLNPYPQTGNSLKSKAARYVQNLRPK